MLRPPVVGTGLDSKLPSMVDINIPSRSPICIPPRAGKILPLDRLLAGLVPGISL